MTGLPRNDSPSAWRRLLSLAVLMTASVMALSTLSVPAGHAAPALLKASSLRVSPHADGTARVTWRGPAQRVRVVHSTRKNFTQGRVTFSRTRHVQLRQLRVGQRYYVRVQAVSAKNRALGRPLKTTFKTQQVRVAPRPASPGPSGTWLSGATPDRAIDTWRGRPSDISGTWNDSYEAHLNQWSLMPQFGHGSAWQGHVDNAIGAIWKDRGETWAAAGNGAYDARWSQVLNTLKTRWGNKPGTMYLRFAHEFNGNWYPWSVRGNEVNDFKKAWVRFSNLQKSIFPKAELVFSPNSDSLGEFGVDWRTAYPGTAHVDVIGVDYYNQYPFIKTSAEWDSTALRYDSFGGPRGLERHRQFAQSVGVPLALPEWSSNASMGDSPIFIERLHQWITQHAGTGPGNLLYEIQFSVPGYNGDFIFFPSTKQPLAAAKYRELW